MRWLVDVHHSIRALRRAPGFALPAIGLLAIGTCANISIFSFVSGMLFRPLPYADSSRVVYIHAAPLHGVDSVGFLSGAEFRELRKRGETAFEKMAFYHPSESATLSGAGEAQHIRQSAVEADALALLGVQPVLGRTFLPEEDQPGRDRVAVISAGLWKRSFGAARDVAGRTIRLNDKPYMVVGVMPTGFQFEDADLWTPLVWTDSDQFPALGRLRTGVSVQQAQAQLAPVVAQLARENQRRWNAWGLRVVPMREFIVEDGRTTVLLLMGAVGFVLLLTCSNLASLLVARGVRRSREIALRFALGADRKRIVIQSLVECIILACLGTLAGSLLAMPAIDALKQLAPADMPRIGDVQFDGRVALFAAALAVVTGICFGLVPALRNSRSVLPGIKSSGSGSPLVRTVLIGSQVSAAVILLIGAGLMILSLARLSRIPVGVNTTGLTTFKVAVPALHYKDVAGQRRHIRSVVASVAQLPGVEAVVPANQLPFEGRAGFIRFRLAGDSEQHDRMSDAMLHLVDSGYFQVLGIPLLRGRTFADADQENRPCVAIVNRRFARMYLGGREPIGEVVYPEGLSGATLGAGCQIVGEVGDVRQWGQAMNVPAELYFSYKQVADWHGQMPGEMAFVVRSRPFSTPALRSLQLAALKVDPDVPVHSVRSLEQLHADTTAQRQFILRLLSVFAAYAILLAGFGVFASISQLAARQTREFAIRVVLGARSESLFALVLRQGLKPVAAGVAAGVLGAAALSHLLTSFLFEVQPLDISTFTVVALFVTGVGLAACFIPAYRASLAEPAELLRTE
jgi:putative ABC transport system permease protein